MACTAGEGGGSLRRGRECMLPTVWGSTGKEERLVEASVGWDALAGTGRGEAVGG